MIKIGQIGKGTFGDKIHTKLKTLPNINIEWVCNSQDKWWKQSQVDWVIITSPTEFHYEQSKYFLQNKTNVFCEKPGTLSVESLLELINLSIQNDLCFYIDDILIYENISLTNEFIYKKWGGSSLNIIDRIAYHHFYLLSDKVDDTSCTIKPIINDLFHKKFVLDFKGNQFIFEYDFEWYHQKIHNIISQSQNDALETMLKQVLIKKVNFEENHRRSIFATTISEFVKSNLYGRCAVIGAGIYGITTAVKLRTNGYYVDLYEAESDILQAASGINQYRIHRGYHYPRSIDTIKSCKNNEISFIKYYNKSIMDNDIEHFYSIATEDSLITATHYLKVLDETGLEWEVVETMPGCDLTIRVNEKLYNPKILKEICHERIIGSGINLLLNNKVTTELKTYQFKVYATYSSLNALTTKKQNYQFELCEKPIFKLPEKYKNKSIVIMDGPFMCFDPYGDSGYHLGGNVIHAIHNRNIGETPEIPPAYKHYLNKGIIKKPKYTNVNRFIESAKRFFPDIDKAEHVGSMFTIRTVLPNKDNTDERPTIVNMNENNFILFSGKIGNCVEASDIIINLIKNN